MAKKKKAATKGARGAKGTKKGAKKGAKKGRKVDYDGSRGAKPIKKPMPDGMPSGQEAASTWNSKRSENQQGGFSETQVDEGAYSVRLTEVTYRLVPSTKDPMFITEYEIIDNVDFEGVKLRDRGWMGNAESVGRVIGRLQAMGIETDELDFSDLPDLAIELTKEELLLEVSVKHSDKINPKSGLPYQNVYVNRPLGDDDEEEEE